MNELMMTSLIQGCVCVCRFCPHSISFMVLPLRRIQFSSVAQSCLTLCDPMNHSMSGLPLHHQLLEFTQTHVCWAGVAIQPSHPLSSPSPALSLSQHLTMFKLKHHRSYTSNAVRWKQVDYASCSYHESQSSVTITFSAEWPPSIARQSMLTQMKEIH